jgi:hypothetical protein
VDATDLPEATELVVWIPQQNLISLKAQELRASRLGVAKVADAIQERPIAHSPAVMIPTQLATVPDIGHMVVPELKMEQFAKLRGLQIPAAKLLRLAGLTPREKEKINVRFVIKFPKNTGTRDIALAFRERGQVGQLGQVNYVFKVHAPRC